MIQTILEAILSCFGKLFTSVINNRLVEYIVDENHTTIGPDKLDSERGIQQWIMCLPLIVLLTSFWQRKSV